MDDIAEVFKSAGTNGAQSVFKKPVLIGKRPGTKSSERAPSKPPYNQNNDMLKQNASIDINGSKSEEKNIQLSVNKSEPESILGPGQTSVPKPNLISLKNVNLNYTPPPSSIVCELPYNLEVIKDGVIIQTEDLKNSPKPFFVFGRLPACDVVLQHPSISRYIVVKKFIDTKTIKLFLLLFAIHILSGTMLCCSTKWMRNIKGGGIYLTLKVLMEHT